MAFYEITDQSTYTKIVQKEGATSLNFWALPKTVSLQIENDKLFIYFGKKLIVPAIPRALISIPTSTDAEDLFNQLSFMADGGPSGGGGEANTASNLGGGEGLFASKVGVDLQFKSLVAGSNITIVPTATELTINSTGGGGISAASNGLYLDGTTVKLGTNPLVENTDIQTGTFNLDINSAKLATFNGVSARFADSFGFAVTTGNIGAGSETLFFALNNQIKYGYKTPTTNAQIEGQNTRMQMLYQGPTGDSFVTLEDGLAQISADNLEITIPSADAVGKILTQTSLINGGAEFAQLNNIASTQYGTTSPFTALPSGDTANGFTFFTESDKDADGTTSYSQLFIHNSITVTLSGTSGTANINVGGTNYLVTFNTDLATTANDWVTANYATLRALSPRITPHALGTGADGRIRIGSIYTNSATLDAITITNVSGDLSGTIGNEFTGSATSAGDHVMIPYEGEPFEGQRLHHTMRVNFSIQSGNIQTADLSLRRLQDDSVVGSVIKVQRDPDVEGNQFVFETYTANGNDPFVLGGFYFALRNDAGVTIRVGDAIGILVQTVFQSPVYFP